MVEYMEKGLVPNSDLSHNKLKMKTELRLGSVIPHGVGGPEAGSINLIYGYLLHEYSQNMYRFISINQIGEDLDEFVMKEPGNTIHINIRYPVYEDFEIKSVEEKNKIRLDVVHKALCRIANYDNKLSEEQLEKIKRKILENNFTFEVIYKQYIYKKNPNQIAKVIIRPEMTQFKFFISVYNENKKVCELLIFIGRANDFYIDKFFSIGKWKNEKEFILGGKDKTVETHVMIESCTANILNLTSYSNPPYYTLMTVGLTKEEMEKANEDWQHSISPAHAAIIRQSLGDGAN